MTRPLPLLAFAMATVVAACGDSAGSDGNDGGGGGTTGTGLPGGGCQLTCEAETAVPGVLSDLDNLQVIDGAVFYYQSSRGVFRSPGGGAAGELIVDPADYETAGLTRDGSKLYAMVKIASTYDYEIRQIDPATGEHELVVAIEDSALNGSVAPEREAFVVVGDAAYWSRDDRIATVDFSDGVARIFADDQFRVWSIDVHEDSLVWSDNALGNEGQGAIRRQPLAGGPFETIVAGLDNPYAVAVAGDTVYFGTDEADGGLFSVPVAGGDAIRIGEAGHVMHAASDGTAAFLSSRSSGGVYRAEGGVVASEIGASPEPGAIDVDGGSVYWFDRSEIAIKRRGVCSCD